MKNTLETRLGIFFALTMVAGFLILELASNVNLFQKSYPLKALFSSVHDLKVGDPVKMAGVDVGHVNDISIADGKVLVTFSVRANVPVKTDSKATIKFLGLLGQNFISLSFGSPTAPKLEPNSMIETAEQPDLSTLMAQLSRVAGGVETLTKNFSSENFGNLLGPLTDFVKENRGHLSSILSNFDSISSKVAGGKGTIGKLIADSTLYESAITTVSNLNSSTADIRSTLAQAKAVVSDINAGKGTLGKLAKDQKLYTETTTAMTNLREILQKINRGQGSAGKLVNDDALYKNAKLTLQKVDKATEGLEDQGPLSVLGIAVNNLF